MNNDPQKLIYRQEHKHTRKKYERPENREIMWLFRQVYKGNI